MIKTTNANKYIGPDPRRVGCGHHPCGYDCGCHHHHHHDDCHRYRCCVDIISREKYEPRDCDYHSSFVTVTGGENDGKIFFFDYTGQFLDLFANVYLKSEIDSKLEEKADKDSVYTKEEVDEALEGKQDTLELGTGLKFDEDGKLVLDTEVVIEALGMEEIPLGTADVDGNEVSVNVLGKINQ